VSAGDTPCENPTLRTLDADDPTGRGYPDTTQRKPMWVVALSWDWADLAAGR
jgi:hypothetical protein